MEWKKIELEDISKIKNFIDKRFQTGDLSGVNLYMWRNAKNLEYFIDEDMLVIRGVEEDIPFIYPPVSMDNERIRETVSHHLKDGYLIRGIPEDIYEPLKEDFLFVEERDRFDYLYLVENLISLKGRKYHKKKNHLNHFLKSYDFQYEHITRENIEDVIRFQRSWCQDRECHLDKGLSSEMDGILEVLENYDQLGITGGLIRIDDEVAAFSIGEEITPDTVLIHIEKGDIQYKGIYQAVNKMTLENEFSYLTYVNREEDLGSENLRKAKESYHPHTLLTKYRSTSKD